MAEHGCGGSGDQPAGYPSDCELTGALLAQARARSAPIERGESWRAALPRAREIKLLLLDVDGVLTDGTIIYTQDGGESKGFNTQDGFGLRILQEAGIEVGLITARRAEAVERRAADLKLSHVYQGIRNKIEAFESILTKTGLRPPQIAYMGDDWLDAQLLQRVGLALAPANAVPEIRQLAHYVTTRAGGRGAVREACDLLIEAVGKRGILLQNYLRS